MSDNGSELENQSSMMMTASSSPAYKGLIYAA
jgi:hypothetical protein